VSKLGTEFLRWLFLTLTYFPVVDYNVVFVRHAIDPDNAKGELLEVHLDFIPSKDIFMDRAPFGCFRKEFVETQWGAILLLVWSERGGKV